MSAGNDLLITVAPTGAETDKTLCPQLPTTPDEILETALRCHDGGAGLIHVHVRDRDHNSTLELERVNEVVSLLREESPMVVQVSTGGSVKDTYAKRLAVLETQPDSCSLSMGSVNFGADVFLNPWGFITELYQGTQELEIVPEFELFDLGQINALRRLFGEYGPPFGGRVHVDFVMNVPGGMPGNTQTLVAAVNALPLEVNSWSATGIGRSTIPVALAALSMGGHLRVGMEDVLTYASGQAVKHNVELVQRAADLGKLAQRSPMSGSAAGRFLGIRREISEPR